MCIRDRTSSPRDIPRRSSPSIANRCGLELSSSTLYGAPPRCCCLAAYIALSACWSRVAASVMDESDTATPTLTSTSTSTSPSRNGNSIASRLRQAIELPFRLGDVDVDVEVSVGVAVSDSSMTDAATLLQQADSAMYAAKQQHLGVAPYSVDDESSSPQRLAMLGELRRGMSRGELVLHYQPKVSLSTGEVSGVEALVRWQHPERGLLPPDDFIPLAERTGLIGPLTDYVLDAA